VNKLTTLAQLILNQVAAIVTGKSVTCSV